MKPPITREILMAQMKKAHVKIRAWVAYRDAIIRALDKVPPGDPGVEPK